MKNFKAIAYHGSDDINLKEIEDIDFDYKKHKDHFLGRGFYLFRDSFKRAKNWTDEQHSGENKKVIEVELDINSEDILNFTSTHWGYELDFIEFYLKVCRSKKIHLGSFIDFLIDEMNVDIKAIAMIDLKTNNHLIPVSSEKYTLFAYGDVQICLKEKKPIMKFVEI